MSTKTRFGKEAKGNSEMAYCFYVYKCMLSVSGQMHVHVSQHAVCVCAITLFPEIRILFVTI